MNECLIYDFEFLGLTPRDNIVVCGATLDFSESEFLSDTPYEYDELVKRCKFWKFDIMEQKKKYGLTAEPATMDWWKEQGEQMLKFLKPMKMDISIADFRSKLLECYDQGNINKTFTRGEMDLDFMKNMMYITNQQFPFHWRSPRDVRSYVDGMIIGTELENNFMPEGLEEKYIAHDPRHDIALDVMRMQTCFRSLLL